MTGKPKFNQLEHQRKQRREARASGMCQSCLWRPIAPGVSQRGKPYTICEDCRQANINYRAERRKRVEVDRRYRVNRPDAAPLCPVCAQPMRQCRCC